MSDFPGKNRNAFFAYRFGCDYANDGQLTLAIGALYRGKSRDILHPGNFSTFGISDEEIVERLKNRGIRKVYVPQGREVLKKLLGVEEIGYKENNDGWIEYDSLWDIREEIKLFSSQSIELIVDTEDRLLSLLDMEKRK